MDQEVGWQKLAAKLSVRLKCSSQPRRPPFCAHNVNNRLLGYATRNYATLPFFSYTYTQTHNTHTKGVQMVVTKA